MKKMDIDNLRMLQFKFEKDRIEKQKHYKELEELRQAFINRFPKESIWSMELDDYVEGKKKDGKINQDTFCYWVEWKTQSLGLIQGSTAYKFGVFYNREDGEYKFTSQFSSADEAIKFLRNEIFKLIKAGEKEDYDTLANIDLSRMFKGKILHLYFPDKYLDIYSKEHVDYHLNALDLLDANKDLNVLEERKLLLDFKNNDKVMKDWSTAEFSDFLYASFGKPIKRKELNPELREYADFEEDYPNIERVKSEFIDFKITRIPVQERSDTTSSFKGVVDFERENKIHKNLGNRGELIVFNKEKEYLKSLGKHKLAEKVEWVSKTDDSAGYDILSLDEEGKIKYIEVKSTNSNPGNANFLISSNQYNKAKSLNNYHVYVVFNAKTENPKIWKIKDFLSNEGLGVVITPINFRVVIGTEQLKNGSI